MQNIENQQVMSLKYKNIARDLTIRFEPKKPVPHHRLGRKRGRETGLPRHFAGTRPLRLLGAARQQRPAAAGYFGAAEVIYSFE